MEATRMSEPRRILAVEMGDRRHDSWTSLAGIAAAGVVLGHWLAYRVAIPEPALRVAVLAATGHAYWLVAVKIAVVLGLAAAGSVLVTRLAGGLRRTGAAPRPASYRSLLSGLAVVQLVAFAAMEVVERLAAHAPLAGLFLHGVFLFGLLFQLAVAAAGAALLAWLARIAERAGAAIRTAPPRLPRPALVLPPPAFCAVRPAQFLAGAAGVRGPPSTHV